MKNMTREKYLERNKEGDYDSLLRKLEKETGVPYNEIIKLIPVILSEVSQRNRTIFVYHYMYKQSIVKIHYDMNIQYTRIEKSLDTVTNYIKEKLLEVTKNV